MRCRWLLPVLFAALVAGCAASPPPRGTEPAAPSPATRLLPLGKEASGPRLDLIVKELEKQGASCGSATPERGYRACTAEGLTFTLAFGDRAEEGDGVPALLLNGKFRPARSCASLLTGARPSILALGGVGALYCTDIGSKGEAAGIVLPILVPTSGIAYSEVASMTIAWGRRLGRSLERSGLRGELVVDDRRD